MPTATCGQRIGWQRLTLFSLGLVALVAAIYGQVANHGFVNFDDPGYILRNRTIREGLTADGVSWAFGTFRMANWHPLTWISHMADVSMWGMDAGGHHLTSVALHALNAVLLLLLLARMTGAIWTSALVAALFAIHPLRVESVAWAAERKDVLAATFFMLALLAHARFAERPDVPRATLVWLMMALGLMAKPMLVTLPFVLLLMDVWPLGRWDRLAGAAPNRGGAQRPDPLTWSRLVIEKVPLLLLAAGSIAITIAAQSSHGAVSSLHSMPLGQRLANVPLSYVTYLRKAFAPTDLACYYPHAGSAAVTGPRLEALPALGALLFLLILTGAAILLARRGRGRHAWLPVGWFWFLGMLVPVIGLVQVGSQALADRYAYLPLIGLSICLAWGLRELAERGATSRRIAAGLSAAMILALLAPAWKQVGTWRNNLTLYEHALEVTRDNYIAHANLGVALIALDRLDEAAEHLNQAVSIAPAFDKAHTDLGSIYLKQEQYALAAAHLKRAISVRPDVFETAYLLGRTHMEQAHLNAAVKWLQRATELRPSSAEAHNDLGLIFGRMGRSSEAMREFNLALQIRPDFPEARANAASLRQGAAN